MKKIMKRIFLTIIVLAGLVVVGAMVGGYFMQDSVKDYRQKTMQVKLKMSLLELRTNLEIYHIESDSYPKELSELVDYTPPQDIEIMYLSSGDSYEATGIYEGIKMQIKNGSKDITTL